MTNEELDEVIAKTYELADEDTEAGRLMTGHLKALLEIQLERAKAKPALIDVDQNMGCTANE